MSSSMPLLNVRTLCKRMHIPVLFTHFHVTMHIFIRTWCSISVKGALDTFGNIIFQRLVFSLAVSKHMHKITNLCKFGLIWSSNWQETNERDDTLVALYFVCFQMHKGFSWRLLLCEWEFTSFSKTRLLQIWGLWGYFSHMHTINRSLSLYQVSFYAIIILSNY